MSLVGVVGADEITDYFGDGFWPFDFFEAGVRERAAAAELCLPYPVSITDPDAGGAETFFFLELVALSACH